VSASGPIADFETNRQKLFELYTKCRYNELCCHKLMQSSMALERAVRWSTALLIASSLLTGSVSYLSQPIFTPVWAIITTLATMVGIYSLIVGSGAREHHWFSMASAFREEASRIEFATEYLRLGKMTNEEFLETWWMLTQRFGQLLHSAGPELPGFSSRYRRKLDCELAGKLWPDRNV
jgi:hypothetical protein